jgi:hypothetical protein
MTHILLVWSLVHLLDMPVQATLMLQLHITMRAFEFLLRVLLSDLNSLHFIDYILILRHLYFTICHFRLLLNLLAYCIASKRESLDRAMLPILLISSLDFLLFEVNDWITLDTYISKVCLSQLYRAINTYNFSFLRISGCRYRLSFGLSERLLIRLWSQYYLWLLQLLLQMSLHISSHI